MSERHLDTGIFELLKTRFCVPVFGSNAGRAAVTGLEPGVHIRPFIESTLQRSARRWTTYYSRALIGLLSGLAAVPVFYSATLTGVGVSLVQYAFLPLLFYALFSGARSTCDSLGSEVREGTLGFLYLSGLGSLDIVLGKLAAASVKLGYSILAVLPGVALLLLMDAAAGMHLARGAVVLGTAVILGPALGIGLSRISTGARQNESAAISWLMVLVCVPPLFTNAADPSVQLLRYLSPWVFWESAFAPGATGEFWSALCGQATLAFLLVCLGTSRVWRAWKRSTRVTIVREGLRQRWLRWNFRSRPERFRIRLLDVNPYYWLRVRGRARLWGTWLIFLGLAFAVATPVWCYAPAGAGLSSAILWVGCLWYFLLKLLFAEQAARPVAELKQSRELELLLATSLRLQDVVRGHWLALTRVFAGPLLLFLAVSAAHGLMVAAGSSAFLTGQQGWHLILTVAVAGMLLLDFAAIGSRGLWQGVRSPNPKQAVWDTLLYVMVLPMACTILSVQAAAIWFMVVNASPTFSPEHWMMGSWLVVGVLGAVLNIWHARRNTARAFRLWAVPDYSAGTGWARLGRWLGNRLRARRKSRTTRRRGSEIPKAV